MLASKYGKAAIGHGKFWVGRGGQPERYSYGPYADQQEAEAEARLMMADDGWTSATIGKGEEVNLSVLDADDVIEDMTQNLYDQCGEGADDYLDYYAVTDDQKRELTEALERSAAEWLTKHNLWPTFCKVESVCVLTPDGEVPA